MINYDCEGGALRLTEERLAWGNTKELKGNSVTNSSVLLFNEMG